MGSWRLACCPQRKATRWLSWYGVGLASADSLPVVVRIPAGPLGSLKCDPPKGNGRRPQKKLLSAEEVGGLAGLGPGCVVVVVIRDIHWRPKALEQQYLHLGKAALLSDVRFCYQFTSSDEIAACGVCP